MPIHEPCSGEGRNAAPGRAGAPCDYEYLAADRRRQAGHRKAAGNWENHLVPETKAVSNRPRYRRVTDSGIRPRDCRGRVPIWKIFCLILDLGNFPLLIAPLFIPLPQIRFGQGCASEDARSQGGLGVFTRIRTLKPDKTEVVRNVLTGSCAQRERTDWIRQAIEALKDADGLERIGVWLEAAPAAEEHPSPVIFRGEVWERDGGNPPVEWTHLSGDSPLPQEVLSNGRSVEHQLGES